MPRRIATDEAIPLDDDPLWYKDALIYELHVRAFADSNGDGIGDFRGLVDKLDYLQDLGVTTLWLLPFYPSPLRDDGYDIADYTSINPIYGTLADFKHFLKESHRRGLRVVTELVLNHTSDQHPWFQRARRAKPGSKERDFYVWSDTPDRYKDARIIFKDFEASNWTWDPVAGAYYWHRFYHHQPDLNYDNPEVHKAVTQVLDFWLELGIDGLRLDAVPYLYEREGTNCENLPETHDMLRALRKHVEEKYGNRMLLAEANQWPEDSVAYFGRGDECQMAFHFPVMPRLFMAIRMEDRLPVIDILQQTPPIPETCQWALFLRNHDELTLEMVTDEDRDYMYRVYAQDPQARINLGIRRRLAPLLEGHRGKIELMNGLLLSLPGTPVIYYGDEIGMGDNIYLGDRNGVRTPMQWTPERNAGFSKANPQRLYVPAIIDPEYHYAAVNVEVQDRNPHSLLWWMKHLLALRKRYRAFGRGSIEFLYPDNPKVLAFVRRHGEETILVVANLSRFIQYVELDLGAFKGYRPVEVLGRTKFPSIGELPYLLTLGSYAFYWFVLQPEAALAPPHATELPALEASGEWETVFRGKARLALNGALLRYITGRRWFAGKDGTPREATILDAVSLDRARLLVVQVEYVEDDPETYCVPLGFAAGKEAEVVPSERRIARLRLKPKAAGDGEAVEGFLYDPLGDRAFTSLLVQTLARPEPAPGDEGSIVGTMLAESPDAIPAAAELPEPWEVPTVGTNTDIAFGEQLFLKAFRLLEEGPSPELEVRRFLIEKTGFSHTPRLVGALEYQRESARPMTLAVVSHFVPNQGHAWQHTIDTLGRYFETAVTTRGRIFDLRLPPRKYVELLDGDLPAEAQELIGPYLESARLLGQRTAELHLALASAPDDPAFAPEAFTTLYQRSLYQQFRSQARHTFEWLRKRWKTLPAAYHDDAHKLIAREEQLLACARSVFEKKITAQRIRIHGDYHLGQVLYTGKDFVILDLEGDQGRRVIDRRRKRPAMRDVASMLRSLHYAAATALRRGNIRPEDIPTLEPWARYWLRWVGVTFLKSYVELAAHAHFLPKDRDEMSVLLDFYLLKRATNELHDELARDPERARVPLRGLLHLLESFA